MWISQTLNNSTRYKTFWTVFRPAIIHFTRGNLLKMAPSLHGPITQMKTKLKQHTDINISRFKPFMEGMMWREITPAMTVIFPLPFLMASTGGSSLPSLQHNIATIPLLLHSFLPQLVIILTTGRIYVRSFDFVSVRISDNVHIFIKITL